MTAPTCLEEGYTTHTCSRCPDSYTDSKKDSLGHDIVTDAAVAATCTETGLTEGSHCTRCNDATVAQTVVEALGHTEEIIEAVEPDCVNKGHTEGVKCSVCDEILTAHEEIAALGHTVVVDEAVATSCEAPGLTAGKHCEVCEKVIVAQVEIPMLDHDLMQIEAKKPTYTDVGWNAYKKCKECSYTTYEEIPAVGEPEINTYEEFIENLPILEELAYQYVLTQAPGKDPVDLLIKYIRTGVERYNSGSWGIMAGYEDAGFAKFVKATEDAYNAEIENVEDWMAVSALKNLNNFNLPNGDRVDLGHMFGTMDITYNNKFGQNHADVAGWAGDLVDLLTTADELGVEGTTMEEKITYIAENYLGKAFKDNSFSTTDIYGDLDGFYVMKKLQNTSYESGVLTDIMKAYFTESLTAEYRADFFLKNRLDGVSLRTAIRDAVYNEYVSNNVITTLEGTRPFTKDEATIIEYRKACCYAFADYLCRLAGDFVEVENSEYLTVFSSETSTLAPGITQDIRFATSADGKQMAYYIATADLTRDDVHLYASYKDNDPSLGWGMQRVEDQMTAAQQKYGDPESEYYIENYNVIAGVNGAGFNMSTGEPGGLLVMGGKEYHGIDGNGFFGVLKDGTPIIGTTEEYNTIYKDQLAEGIAGFGSTLVKDGKVVITATSNYYSSRASRTAAGITKTGKVVLMVLDGRQEPFSCGGSMIEIAQIMLEAGCVEAINLDGGGSTTFVAKQEGEDTFSVVNRPSDGYARSVSTALILVSTAPNSTAFHHANIETDADYMTVGASVKATASGVSATGNAAELPEGTTWAVSDERFGTITEDGVFTGLRTGSVDIRLMLGEEILATKTVNIVVPDNIYFAKESLKGVYGEAIELPVKAVYTGKAVNILEKDVTFTMNNTTAGTIDGFTFTGIESNGVKFVTVTAALTDNPEATADAEIALYKQGEASFDFDQATAGDRQFAWDRKVSNATTKDNITYTVVNPDEPMETSYIFAIDMTQIPIPEQLNDLIYMLPGADAEDACAWTFLLQLAERISVLTEVKPVIRFDKNFDVDYSNLTVVNEYFQLNKTEFNEETNELTLTLNWIDQTQAIDPTMANPMCILSGIKLTPKEDAQWNTKDQLNVVNSGEIGYKIYLRASALYSFAQKPENQATYGIYPFENPDLPSEKGGYFESVYKEFEDSYTLVKALKNGWVTEEGGFAYYKDGEKYKGIQEVDGLYYNFGENGINIGQEKYTGLFEKNGNTHYALRGEIKSGWTYIKELGGYYYFNPSNYAAVDGEQTIGGYNYTFVDKLLVKGQMVKTSNGTMYRWAGEWLYHSWFEYEGNKYYVRSTRYIATGLASIDNKIHAITDEGIWLEDLNGLYDYNGKTYYVEDGIVNTYAGLVYVDGYYYYFNSADWSAVKGRKYWISKTNGLLPEKSYTFDEYGRIVEDVAAPDTPTTPTPTPDQPSEVKNGIYEEDGGLFYYKDGVRNYAGLIIIDGYYYYVRTSGQLATGQYWTTKTNGLLPEATYTFGEDGKMIEHKPDVPEVKNGIYEEDGGLFYYENSIRTYAGLIEIDGDYYYVRTSGQLATGRYWTTKTNGLLPQASYEFGEDGKMIKQTENPDVTPDEPGTVKNGIYSEDGGLYYYVNGVRNYAGLIAIDGNYYYVRTSGQLATGRYWITKTNDVLPEASYIFGSDGKMIIDQNVPNPDTTPTPDEPGEIKNGIVAENGGLFYYVDGVREYAGLIQIDGDYYYVRTNGQLATGRYWITKTNGLLPEASYKFGSDGKMNMEGVVPEVNPDEPSENIKNGIIEEDGKLFYYVNNVKTYAGLIQIDGDYYYAKSDGQLVTGRYWITKTNGLLTEGGYTFDTDGKLIK